MSEFLMRQLWAISRSRYNRSHPFPNSLGPPLNAADAFLTALVLTILLSVVAAAALWRPLLKIFSNVGGQERAAFWQAYTSLLLVLVPLVAMLLGRSEGSRTNSQPLFDVADQFRWGLFGLITILAAIGAGVLAAGSGRAMIEVGHDQLDDLNRLLARVEEIRARNILKRPDSDEKRA